MTMTEEELLKKKKELGELKRIGELELEAVKVDSEIKKVQAGLQQLEFRKKHSKLVKFTNSISRGVKGFFGAIFKGVKKVPGALAKSDDFIREQRRKDFESKRVQPKQDSYEDALHGIE